MRHCGQRGWPDQPELYRKPGGKPQRADHHLPGQGPGAYGYGSPLFPNGAELTIEMGGHTYKNMLEIPAEIALCADRAAYLDLKHQKDDLSQHLKGRETLSTWQAGADPVHGPGIPGACDQPAL